MGITTEGVFCEKPKGQGRSSRWTQHFFFSGKMGEGKNERFDLVMIDMYLGLLVMVILLVGESCLRPDDSVSSSAVQAYHSMGLHDIHTRPNALAK